MTACRLRSVRRNATGSSIAASGTGIVVHGLPAAGRCSWRRWGSGIGFARGPGRRAFGGVPYLAFLAPGPSGRDGMQTRTSSRATRSWQDQVASELRGHALDPDARRGHRVRRARLGRRSGSAPWPARFPRSCCGLRASRTRRSSSLAIPAAVLTGLAFSACLIGVRGDAEERRRLQRRLPLHHQPALPVQRRVLPDAAAARVAADRCHVHAAVPRRRADAGLDRCTRSTWRRRFTWPTCWCCSASARGLRAHSHAADGGRWRCSRRAGRIRGRPRYGRVASALRPGARGAWSSATSSSTATSGSSSSQGVFEPIFYLLGIGLGIGGLILT